jgi:uncharacterized membrane protein
MFPAGDDPGITRNQFGTARSSDRGFPMRSAPDRIRHAISFEIIGLVLVTPLATALFGLPVMDVGVIAIGSATAAALWNYVYNLGFDHALLRLTRSIRKSWLVRVVHAVLFEGGLLLLLVPMIALYLGVGLAQAFLIDVTLAVFYLVYAFAFNLAYDVVFPVPE